MKGRVWIVFAEVICMCIVFRLFRTSCTWLHSTRRTGSDSVRGSVSLPCCIRVRSTGTRSPRDRTLPVDTPYRGCRVFRARGPGGSSSATGQRRRAQCPGSVHVSCASPFVSAPALTWTRSRPSSRTSSSASRPRLGSGAASANRCARRRNRKCRDNDTWSSSETTIPASQKQIIATWF